MIIYVVEAGDTISSIASEYGLTAEAVTEFNQLTNPDNLVIGQTILLPIGETNIERSIATNGYLYPNINRETLSKTLPYLTYGTIFTYGFDTSGNLVTINDEEVIEMMRTNGTAPLMLLSTLTPEGFFSNSLAHSLLINTQTQDVLIENVLNTMREKGYYGLDIDFEYVLPEDKDAFVAFVEKVAARLNAEGFEVFVALAPKVSADQPGLLYESHDYARLGAAANYVLLMTYEWGYTYGPPMAVAPINKVREVLDYAVTEIPREKIFMGIPNYGYDWTLPFVRGTSRARSVGNVEAVELAAQVGAIIEFDEVAMAPYFYYNDAMGNEHVVWFEDARSIAAKLDLIREYGFRGAGYWNIMRFFPQNWIVLENTFGIEKVL